MPLELEDPTAFPVMSHTRAFQFADPASTQAAYMSVRQALNAHSSKSVRALRWSLDSLLLIHFRAIPEVMIQWTDMRPGDEVRIVRQQWQGKDVANLWIMEWHRIVSVATYRCEAGLAETYGLVGLFAAFGPVPPWHKDFEEQMRFSLKSGVWDHIPGALSPRTVDGETVAR